MATEHPAGPDFEVIDAITDALLSVRAQRAELERARETLARLEPLRADAQRMLHALTVMRDLLADDTLTASHRMQACHELVGTTLMAVGNVRGVQPEWGRIDIGALFGAEPHHTQDA